MRENKRESTYLMCLKWDEMRSGPAAVSGDKIHQATALCQWSGKGWLVGRSGSQKTCLSLLHVVFEGKEGEGLFIVNAKKDVAAGMAKQQSQYKVAPLCNVRGSGLRCSRWRLMVIRKLHGCYKSVRDEAKTSVQPTKKPISSPSKVWVFLFLQEIQSNLVMRGVHPHKR